MEDRRMNVGNVVAVLDCVKADFVSRAVDEVASAVSVMAIRGTRLAVGRPG